MIFTNHYDEDGAVRDVTVTDAQPVERFSAELLAVADGPWLTYDRESGVATASAGNGTWRYKVSHFDTFSYGDEQDDRTLVGYLIEAPE
jgi:hypothetical protein